MGQLVCPPLGPTVLDDEVLPLDVAKVAQTLLECLDTGIGGTGIEPTDPVHFRQRLRVDGERRYEQAQDECHDEPDGTVPHGRLLASASCRPAPFHGSRTLALTCCRKRERRRSGRWRQSGAALC